MSDLELRELERTWQTTGLPADHARLLLVRSRAGLLGRERIELAAYLGNPGAKAAVGSCSDDPPWSGWARALDPAAASVLVLHANYLFQGLVGPRRRPVEPPAFDYGILLELGSPGLIASGGRDRLDGLFCDALRAGPTGDTAALAELVVACDAYQQASSHLAGTEPRLMHAQVRGAERLIRGSQDELVALREAATCSYAAVREALVEWALDAR